MKQLHSGCDFRTNRDAWWISPLFLVALNFLIISIAFFQPDSSFLVEYRSRKRIGLNYVLLCAFANVLLWSGAYFGCNGLLRKASVIPRELEYRRVFMPFYVITIIWLAAYLNWMFRMTLIWGGPVIGSNCFFSCASSIKCFGSVSIGNNCLFGEGVKIYDHNHIFNLEGLTVAQSGYKSEPVIIGDNCWVSSNFLLLKAMTIGDGCVIAAGTVVKSNLPPNHMLAIDRTLTPIIRRAAA